MQRPRHYAVMFGRSHFTRAVVCMLCHDMTLPALQRRTAGRRMASMRHRACLGHHHLEGMGEESRNKVHWVVGRTFRWLGR